MGDPPFAVLVVDDDPDTRENLRDILELDGYAVEGAGTAADALARDDWPRYGAVLLDRRLPDGTAEDILARLRAAAPEADVVIVTGSADVAATIAAFRLGAADYVLKPVSPDELRARLGRIAGHRRDRAALRAASAARDRALEELRATTQQLWQAARLAGVGELAASIAHELNNPLATVSLRVEGVLAKTPPDDPRRRPLEVVQGEVERMGRLVANLLNFSRAGREQVSTVDVCDEVAKTLDLTDHHLRKRGIAVGPEFAPGVPAIYADRQQLRQVFLNLVTNAADAMPAGGRLTPRVRTGTLPPAREAVVVEVTDTGVGIPPDHLPRVTDPFFTTKPEGQGTGLGLAICKRIVDQHHGALEIDSRLGEGTTVRVTLPVKNGANVAGLHAG
ncbi:MAG: response regulator [Gemmataceae bacterium]|nr:response regulator [Gemmataceae bacterium]